MECGDAGHMASMVRKRRDGCWFSADPSPWNAVASIQGGSSLSFKPPWKHHHRHAQGFICEVIVNPNMFLDMSNTIKEEKDIVIHFFLFLGFLQPSRPPPQSLSLHLAQRRGTFFSFSVDTKKLNVRVNWLSTSFLPCVWCPE